MQIKDLYLCGIGAFRGIERFEVGRYNKERDSFYFGNGAYGDVEISSKPMGSNATIVISATPLNEIDGAGLLYKYENNV